MHPEEAEAYVEAFSAKQEADHRRHGEIMYLLALGAQITIGGRKPKLGDFLPAYIRDKDAGEVNQAQREAELSRKFKLLAQATKHLKKHG